jgi:hypothetical protein
VNRRLAVLIALSLIVAACNATDEPAVTAPPEPTTATTTPATTTSIPAGTTTTLQVETTLPAVDGTSLADVAGWVQAGLESAWSVRDHQPGELGPYQPTCVNAAATPAHFGDVFACPGLPQTDDTLVLEPVGVVMMVVDDTGRAAWLSGADIPSDMAGIEALFRPHAGAHFCRELRNEAGHPFDLGYRGALLYWLLDGRPDRMDADGDGVPCETVFSYEEVLEVWGGTPLEAALEDPREAYQFAFVTEVAADGSSVTLDYAEFLSGDEANAAAVAAGEITEGEQVPNDYYIRNDNPLLRTFPIAPDARVSLMGFSLENQGIDAIPVTAAQWATLFIEAQRCIAEGFPSECEELGGDDWSWYGGGFLPYWVLIEGDVIVAVEEQYLP